MLKAKKKYTRKKIKQDQFVIMTMQVKQFLEDNIKSLTYGILMIALVLMSIVFVINSKNAAEAEAVNSLADVENLFRNGKNEEAIDQSNLLLEEFPGTNAAGKAVFALGKFYWSVDSLAPAKHYFKLFIDEYLEKNIVGQAALASYGNCLAYEKQYQKAAEYYEKAVNIDPDFPQVAAYLYSAAQAYREAGNHKKALVLSQKIIDNYDNSNYKNRAEILSASLSSSESN